LNSVTLLKPGRKGLKKTAKVKGDSLGGKCTWILAPVKNNVIEVLNFLHQVTYLAT
jgi:hypothetical protein